MAILYKLSENYNQVIQMADQLDDGTLKDTLDSINEAFDDKAENIAKSIKEIEGQADIIKAEKERLAKREQAMRNNAKSMKSYLQEQMDSVGKKKIQGELLTVAIQKNAPSVKIESEQYIPKGFFEPQPPKLNKTELKNELKNGLEILGVELIQTESLRIR
ncbi:siphovirus Gp157 family protein [Enterococcus avium]|uniref:siphovirus Gp157 family protein n=1 Tax=Enterococcus avium TaxID=33945 RepID=UPI0032E4AC4E